MAVLFLALQSEDVLGSEYVQPLDLITDVSIHREGLSRARLAICEASDTCSQECGLYERPNCLHVDLD